MDGRKGKMWDKMKMVNAVKAIKRKEMGFKEESKVLKHRDRHSKIKLTAWKEI